MDGTANGGCGKREGAGVCGGKSPRFVGTPQRWWVLCTARVNRVDEIRVSQILKNK